MRILRSFSMRVLSSIFVAGLTVIISPPAFAGGPAATTTTLSASATTISTGTAWTLTATVKAGSAIASPGLVVFCDSTATYCEGPAVLGSAQVTSAGIASIRISPGIGSHSAKAVFVGNQAFLPSASAASSVTVTGLLPSTTALSTSGAVGSYSLTATVGYHGLLLPGTNEIASFLDTSNNNLSLGTMTLSNLSVATYGFTTIPTSPIASGNLPTSIVIADLNGDGIPDIAVANFLGNTVSVFIGNLQGGFTAMAGSPFAVGRGPRSLAVADFNSDGLVDIAVANATDATVTILLGRSGGSFVLGSTTSTGLGPQAIAVGDFNNDGIPDIAVANQMASTITIMTGDGLGHFTTNTILSGGNPNAVVSADFNGDGFADIAFVNTSDSTVGVLLGNGTGTFTPMTGSPFATPAYPSSLAVGDFNGDGKADLAVASGTQNNVTVLLNTGATFTVATGSPYAVGMSPGALAIGDFNGDGKQDMVIANAGDNTATVLLGDGSGKFVSSSQPTLMGFGAPSSIAVADFDGDGTQDFAITNLQGNLMSLRPLLITQSASGVLNNVPVPGGGTHLVEASYLGDTSYASSVSATSSLAGTLIATASSLFVSPSTTVQYRQVDQLTASITPYIASNYTATGTVSFLDGTTALNTPATTIATGQAAISVFTLAVGPHNLTAKYSGDSNFAASTSGIVAVTVTRANTTTTLASSATSTTPGLPVTFTATVVAVTSGVPTTTVTFADGATTLGQGTLNSTGVATFTTSSLLPGSHSITATYAGDANYAGSTSAILTETVSDFNLILSPASQTVIPGQSVSYGLQVAPLSGGFASAVSFSISGLPSGATATFSPSSITPGASVGVVTILVTTPRTMGMIERSNSAPTLAIVAGLLLLPFARRKSRQVISRAVSVALLLIVGIAAFAALTGCGGNSGLNGQAVKNYTFTITATGGGISHTTSANLNVQ